MPQTRIGTSGWRYAPWRGKFYPPKLPQRAELTFAAHCFNSIEINGSFYSLQSPGTYKRWYDATPDDFVFSIKGSRFITHMKRLQRVAEAQANFWASGILLLEEKLGPILWQLPPSFHFDSVTLARFFDGLPRTSMEAATIARRHSPFMKNRSWVTAKRNRRLRHAIEIRHESFMTEEFTTLLRKYRIALVIADTAQKWPYMEDITSDFVYVRLHGDVEIYSSGYKDKALDLWADRIRKWRQRSEAKPLQRHSLNAELPRDRDVYVYFDNDVKAYAPFNAIDLARRLGITRDCGMGTGE